ncbi:hypothetical protein CHUAL_011936 [Chamberlinius hualienensis]
MSMSNSSNLTLTDEQYSLLLNMSSDGIKCMLKYWTAATQNSIGLQCNASWDNVFCWPPTPANTVAERSCADEAQLRNHPNPAVHEAKAYRVCDSNGEWKSGKTNFDECLAFLAINEEHHKTADVMAYIMFIGSLLSFIALTLTLVIFFYFKSLQCDRITVHKHLSVALLIRVILNFIMVEPIISGRSHAAYTDLDWLCKAILILKMYFILASVNWMFIEGLYLHSRVTTSVFNSKPPFKLYYALGWGDPLIIITLWSVIMVHSHHTKCWNGYAKLNHIWILYVPIYVALAMNLLFLINIIRILVTKLRASVAIETAQVRKAIKATAVLFPLLGLPNLFIGNNPNDDGSFENVYLYANTAMESSQGIFVAILYCFTNCEVITALKKEYTRFMYRIRDSTTSNNKLRHTSCRSVSFLENTATSFAANNSRQLTATNNLLNPTANVVLANSAAIQYKSPLREVKKSFWVRWAIKCQRPSTLIMSKEEEEHYLQKKAGTDKRSSESDCLV